MPLSNYNGLFGGKPGSAQKAYQAMLKTYGPNEGKRVFYAVVAERKRGKGQGQGGLRQAIRRRKRS